MAMRSPRWVATYRRALAPRGHRAPHDGAARRAPRTPPPTRPRRPWLANTRLPRRPSRTSCCTARSCPSCSWAGPTGARPPHGAGIRILLPAPRQHGARDGAGWPAKARAHPRGRRVPAAVAHPALPRSGQRRFDRPWSSSASGMRRSRPTGSASTPTSRPATMCWGSYFHRRDSARTLCPSLPSSTRRRRRRRGGRRTRACCWNRPSARTHTVVPDPFNLDAWLAANAAALDGGGACACWGAPRPRVWGCRGRGAPAWQQPTEANRPTKPIVCGPTRRSCTSSAPCLHRCGAPQAERGRMRRPACGPPAPRAARRGRVGL